MRIAIIGGIGSGKSEALKVAAEMGITTLSADEINSQLLEDTQYINEIETVFPSVVVNGRIDRNKLAEIVFSDNEALNKLNAIAHPRILKRITEDVADPLAVEMPLLFEIDAQHLFDEIVLVYAPVQLRLKRLEVRGMTAAQAKRRMSAQADEDSLKSVATKFVYNLGDLDELRKNVRKAFDDILGL